MEYMEETALQKEPEITVLKVEPGKEPEEVTIPNTLEAMQQMVGGAPAPRVGGGSGGVLSQLIRAGS